MEKNGEITNKNDVIVRASNFVVEHAKTDLFAKHYVLDE
jgi:calcium-dependent protein kinase